MSEDTNVNPSFEDAFSTMESSLDNLPEGSFVTLQHEANPPMFVSYTEGESLTIRGAIDRRGLTIGNVNAYVDGNVVSLDTPIAAGTIVTLVGNVKGGTL
jgi:molybdopterin converting factor small subunit